MTDFGTKFVRAAFPADLKDGGIYGTRNGRVVKLSRSVNAFSHRNRAWRGFNQECSGRVSGEDPW